MRKFKKILFTILLCFSTLSLTACDMSIPFLNVSGDGAKEVATTFLDSTLSFGFEKAIAVSTGDALDKVKLIQAYSSNGTEITSSVDAIDIIDVSTHGKYADVEALVTRSITVAGESSIENKTVLVSLVKLDGAWYVYDMANIAFN